MNAWRLQLEPRAVYVHVPFCHQRCPYCNFSIVIDRSHLTARYLAAVDRELSLFEPPTAVDTVFVGGGTPTLLSLKSLESLMQSLRRWLPQGTIAEWTIEANPKDLSSEKCQALRDLGINRLSIGGQSFHDTKLVTLGRDHRGDELRQALETALRWIPNVALDLIFGVPGETRAMWQQDLDEALRFGLHHMSTYGLTFEKGTAYWSQREKGSLKPVPEEVELAMYCDALARLTDHGFEHYEVSNFAKPGFACRHNQTYWSLQPWYGFGPGAAAYLDDERTVNHRSTTKYLERIESNRSPVAEREAIDWAQWTRERFVFGMRRLQGISLAELSRDAEPQSLQHILQTTKFHQEMGWLVHADERIRLTRAGLVISDSLWPEYL